MRLSRWLGGDTHFLVAFALLVALGLVFLSSASAPLAYERFHNRSYYLVHQILSGVLPGLIVFLVCARLRRAVLPRLAVPLYVASAVLLALVFIPGLGVAYGRTKNWLALGPLTFQPAEVAKLGLILALAAWATVRRPTWFHVRSWSFGLAPFLLVLGIIIGLIALQPDVGTMVIVVAIGVAIAFAAGIPWAQLGTLVIAGAAFLASLIAVAPYRLARLTVFIHPEYDPQGIGYQVNQALLAVGSGRLQCS
jgi:cell division protein FtsW